MTTKPIAVDWSVLLKDFTFRVKLRQYSAEDDEQICGLWTWS